MEIRSPPLFTKSSPELTWTGDANTEALRRAIKKFQNFIFLTDGFDSESVFNQGGAQSRIFTEVSCKTSSKIANGEPFKLKKLLNLTLPRLQNPISLQIMSSYCCLLPWSQERTSLLSLAWLDKTSAPTFTSTQSEPLKHAWWIMSCLSYLGDFRGFVTKLARFFWWLNLWKTILVEDADCYLQLSSTKVPNYTTMYALRNSPTSLNYYGGMYNTEQLKSYFNQDGITNLVRRVRSATLIDSS